LGTLANQDWSKGKYWVCVDLETKQHI
jgi:hypothetical protein